MDSSKDKYRDECLNKLQNKDWEQTTRATCLYGQEQSDTEAIWWIWVSGTEKQATGAFWNENRQIGNILNWKVTNVSE